MPTQLVFDPELNLSLDDFVEAWNASQQHREAANARVESQAAAQFVDAALTQAGVVVLGSLTSGLLASAAWDLIKELLFEQGVRKKSTYKEISQPDGTHIMIITIEEG